MEHLKFGFQEGGPWHEKFFFIEGEADEQPFWIDVNGSSNPTYHGSGKKGGQSNRITRVGFQGLYKDEEYVKKAEEDWIWYYETPNHLREIFRSPVQS